MSWSRNSGFPMKSDKSLGNLELSGQKTNSSLAGKKLIGSKNSGRIGNGIPDPQSEVVQLGNRVGLETWKPSRIGNRDKK